jgi:hypothetical protein
LQLLDERRFRSGVVQLRHGGFRGDLVQVGAAVQP